MDKLEFVINLDIVRDITGAMSIAYLEDVRREILHDDEHTERARDYYGSIINKRIREIQY